MEEWRGLPGGGQNTGASLRNQDYHVSIGRLSGQDALITPIPNRHPERLIFRWCQTLRSCFMTRVF